MEKTAIKNFAVEARRCLTTRIKARLQERLKERANSTHGLQQERQRRLYLAVQRHGVQHTVERAAYTWFNRLVALRYLEVNGLLDAPVLEQMVEDDAVYTQHILECCRVLGRCLPGLFGGQPDETELLVEFSATDPAGVVRRLLDTIPAEDFQHQVEIIGCMYQYYNTELKDRTFAQLRKNVKISKECLPAVTQFFTPHWLVRYLVENSLGRVLLERFPQAEALRSQWVYFVENGEEPTWDGKQRDIRRLRVMDPCMGSGHILVYAFDLLMQLYRALGWSDAKAVRSILENNLYGMDVDDIAYQLAYFSVMMKACTYDPTVLREGRIPHIMSTLASDGICANHVELLGGAIDNEMEYEKVQEDVHDILRLFSDAKEYGSVLCVEREVDFDQMERFVMSDRCEGQLTFDTQGYDKTQRQLQWLLGLARCLCDTYDVVVTNPPYMGKRGMSDKLSAYVKQHYPDSRHDLCTVFIEKCMAMTQEGGYCAILASHSFMFLSSYEALRKKILRWDITGLVHLGAHAFEEIGGEVVQTAAMVLHSADSPRSRGTYVRLVDEAAGSKQSTFLSGKKRYTCAKEVFLRLPGNPFAYWTSQRLLKLFDLPLSIRQAAHPKQGMATTDTARFLRYWFEVPVQDIAFGCGSRRSAQESQKKWFPINKGGPFRKWYGNNWMVVNYAQDGREIKQNVMARYPYLRSPDFVVKNQEFYFQEGITWTLISTTRFGVRCFPKGMLFDVSAHCLFCDDEDMRGYLAGYLNSNLAQSLLEMMNPTLNCPSGVVGRLPLMVAKDQVAQAAAWVRRCVALARADWDDWETSWDFQQNPLARLSGQHPGENLFRLYDRRKAEMQKRLAEMQQLENQLNALYNRIFGVEGEVSDEVPEQFLTLNRPQPQEEARALISWLVGICLGRYDAKRPGLCHSKSKTPPVLDMAQAPSQVIKLLEEIFGSQQREENLAWLTGALGVQAKTPEKALAKYFSRQFYRDHVRMYQKSPIYWMFRSGNTQALAALHRLDEGAVEQLRGIFCGCGEDYQQGLIYLSQHLPGREERICDSYERLQQVACRDGQVTLLVKR